MIHIVSGVCRTHFSTICQASSIIGFYFRRSGDVFRLHALHARNQKEETYDPVNMRGRASAASLPLLLSLRAVFCS
jgi:hypothetical protein